MLPVWAIMAIAGAAKGTADKKQEARDRHAAAVTKLYQPWTGMQADPIQKGDVAGSALQGAVAGYGVDQSMEANKMYGDYLNKFQTPAAAPAAGADPAAMTGGASVSSPGAVNPAAPPQFAGTGPGMQYQNPQFYRRPMPWTYMGG